VFEADIEGFPVSGRPAWQSNGGPAKGSPAKSCPYSLEVSVGPGSCAVHLLGVFAMYAGADSEAPGTLGASVHLVEDGKIVYRQDLVNGRHYSDAFDPEPVDLVLGDGTSRQTVGEIPVGKSRARVDLLSIDLPNGCNADHLRFRDLGTPASFSLFDVFVETARPHGCPFHERGGGIPLSEVGACLRMADRVKFFKAVDQLEQGLMRARDLDEARSQTLTFIAIVTAALLEMGGSRAMHRVQLETARELDRLESVEDIAEAARTRVESLVCHLMKEQEGPSSHLVDRALAIVDRNFAKNLSDATVAAQLGLSTSHFRFLFRQATGQPFHKYLVALRLEKAKAMLVDGQMTVSAVARQVGFQGLSHFSRAFTQRFNISPTSVRRSTP